MIKNTFLSIAIGLCLFFLVNVFLTNWLRKYKSLPRRKIAGAISGVLFFLVTFPLIFFRPFMTDAEKLADKEKRRQALIHVIGSISKHECLSADGLTPNVKEGVANELRLNPSQISLGRMLYDEKCIAVLYVPTGIYICNLSTTVSNKLVSECKAKNATSH